MPLPGQQTDPRRPQPGSGFPRLVPPFGISAAVGLAAVALALPVRVHAQWLTQTVALTNGWNAVYLHVSPDHTDLNTMVAGDPANPILEVWRWHSTSAAQFDTDPQQRTDLASEWTTWERSNPVSDLRRMTGNAAYLVRVGTNVTSYVWTIQGRPVAPINEWSATGLNFIGFPTVPSAPPTVERFFSLAPELQQNPQTEMYYYKGGELGDGNPARLLSARRIVVARGQAFWLRSGDLFNHYFGPFEMDLNQETGIDFGENHSVQSFVLRNLTSSNLTVSAALLESEPPPSGQPAIGGVPPLLIRGALDLTNRAYGYSTLAPNQAASWTLAPRGQSGDEREVVVGLNRSAISAPAGTRLAAILRLTDSLGFTQLDAPVTADVGSSAGLWVGKALVTEVGQQLKSFVLDGQGSPVVSSGGAYLVAGTETSLAPVPSPFALRMIVHNPESGNAALLQRVYLGLGQSTNYVAANRESLLLGSSLGSARRVSSAHLPWTESNQPWWFGGRLAPSSWLTNIVEVGYNDHQSNPFLHTFHPDHDNLDATFKKGLPQGSESYGIRRQITLHVLPPPDDFSSLVGGGTTFAGEYFETLTLSGLARAGGTNDARQFQTRGVFTLNRIAPIPTLTLAP